MYISGKFSDKIYINQKVEYFSSYSNSQDFIVVKKLWTKNQKLENA